MWKCNAAIASTEAWTLDEFTLFQWSDGFFLDSDYNVWIANKKEHIIKYIDKEGFIFIIVGRIGESGYLDGDAVAALFNSPSSLVVFTTEKVEATYIPYFYAAKEGCENVGEANYQDCSDDAVTIDKLDQLNLEVSYIKDNLKLVEVIKRADLGLNYTTV